MYLLDLLKLYTIFIKNNLDVPSHPCLLFIKADYHQPTVTKWKFTVMQLLETAKRVLLWVMMCLQLISINKTTKLFFIFYVTVDKRGHWSWWLMEIPFNFSVDLYCFIFENVHFDCFSICYVL